MTSELFENWIETELIKSIPKGYTIIMDNAAFHRKNRLEDLAQMHGFKLLFLPAYSPDFNPIEKTWANLKRALVDILPYVENLESGIYNYFALNGS
jgi:transposase